MPTPYDRPARPWDLFNKNLGRVTDTIAAERLAICKTCPELETLDRCKQCGCFMQSKTKLPNANCPLGKWGMMQISYKEEETND
jgi:hypothetical protein